VTHTAKVDPNPSGPVAAGAATREPAATLYGAPTTPRTPRRSRTTVRDVAAAKNRGEKWSMLTAYDATTAAVFDEAEIPVLLVGDSAANVVYGYDTTVPITVDELLPLVRAVVRGAPHAMVVADLPFGSYQAGPTQALATATRFLKEGGAHAVKLEGGARMISVVETLVGAGIPVMGHLGLTPQSIHTIGGYRVQGRDEAGAVLLADALAIEAAGAFAVVLEVVPADLAARVTKELHIATVGIGAGGDCDAQVLVWQDMAGLSGGHTPRFVKRYADLRGVLGDAARAFQAEVRGGIYPTIEHSY
jgi:3-methyl-2-oxobutanoate hydroxymethyltransferase